MLSSLSHITQLKCLICDNSYDVEEVDYVCPKHGNDGTLDVQYDYDSIRRQFKRESLRSNLNLSMWRYAPLLPILPQATLPPLRVGWTPLYDASRIAAELSLAKLTIKDDGQQPTNSLKDRASAIAIVKAQERQACVIATASTGNAAAALSGLCASTGQKNVIFVPESIPPAKLAQLLIFGSTVFLVKGSYNDAFNLCLMACDHYGWYNRNTGFNPYMTEGKKTVAYEICEQLDWNVPDAIFVSVGDGCIIGGVHKGLKDLFAIGWIERIPRLIGVQASGSNYLADAWINNEDLMTKPEIEANTIADSISTGLPRDRFKAMNAVKETDGAFVTVTDREILAAISDLAQKSGVFAEPAGAASYAGLIKAVHQGIISSEDHIVIINTGNGLKDISSAQHAAKLTKTRLHSIPSDLVALKNIMICNDNL